MHEAYIALGSNIENPVQQIESALKKIAQLPETTLLATSTFYHNPPVGLLEQPDFVNAVAKIDTTLSAQRLLAELLRIETEQGRIRIQSNGPRTLDLDLLLHGQLVMSTPELELPHPRMKERAFVLVPLTEISPELCLPCGTSVRVLLKACDQATMSPLTIT